MKLIFGLACDGRTYPDFPGFGNGVFGEAVVGPIGLVSVLETHLGLTGPRHAGAVRIAAYAAKLRATLTVAGPAFFTESFERDPWATAEFLLGWRDQLVTSGWNFARCGADRPDALALVEANGSPLLQGFADRLHALMAALDEVPALNLASLTLIEPRALLTLPCRRLVDHIEACGVPILSVEIPASGDASDLERTQSFLKTGIVSPLSGDGTLLTLEADTELMAAEALSEWLAAGSEEDLAGTVIVSSEGDTALLDLAMQSRGLPALGLSPASPWRGALQVLPLAFAANWAPFDAKALLDLLLLPRPPIDRAAARKLARALSREPGTGGTAWTAAWADIGEMLVERHADKISPQAAINRQLARWKDWTSGGVHDRKTGMPAQAARDIAARVALWAIETDAGSEDPLLLSVAGAASALGQAIDVLGQESLPALLVGRIIEQVLAEGSQNPDHVATAGGLRCVKHPGAIWGDARRIVWWNFTGPGERVKSSPWSQGELDALATVGCCLDRPADDAARIEAAYVNALLRAGERVILISPALSRGSETISHPLGHQLQPLTGPAAASVRWSAERLLQQASHSVAGRTLTRECVAIVTPPQARPHWDLPATAVAKLADRRESATSFERLADCQMRWMLLDVLRLSRGRFSEIPGPDQLLGNLAHEIANKILRPGRAPDADVVRQEVDRVFNTLLAAIATPLQQPEFAGELAAARSKIPLALGQLAHLLRERGLEVVGTELDREGNFANGLSVQGRLDLVVRHPTRGLGVIDLKWTKSAKRRQTELAEGRALQLATYGAIADPAGGLPIPGAYYLLNQRRLIGPSGAVVADEEIASARSLGETWTDLIETWQAWRDLASQGSVVATGLGEAAEHIPQSLRIIPSAEPCRFCELTGLCRVTVEAA